jgi:hypothetical protein
MKFKVSTGYKEEQAFFVDESEVHKAYFLFLNPDKRSIFNNGSAIVGRDIKSIEPDYHGALGFNRGYTMVAEDYAIINREGGVGKKAQEITARAKDVAYMAENDQSVLNLPLGEVKMLKD